MLSGFSCKKENQDDFATYSIATDSSSVIYELPIEHEPDEEKFMTLYSRRMATGEIPSKVRNQCLK